MKRLYWALLVLGSISCLLSCTKAKKLAPPESIPEAQVLYPLLNPVTPQQIADSIDVFVAARDSIPGSGAGAVRHVQFWFVRPDLSRGPDLSVQFGDVTSPMSQVPDSIQVPAGWKLYSTRWYTGGIARGGPNPQEIPTDTYVQVYAIAYDASGNSGRSDLVRVRIVNTNVHLKPPTPRFTVTPRVGVASLTAFKFDASATVDTFDTDPKLIDVRWDLDGDSTNGYNHDGWDFGDWDQPGFIPAHPTDVQHMTYSLARTYVIRMQAKNSYFPGVLTTRFQLHVVNKGGTPHPPDEPNPGSPSTINPTYVKIPTGVFAMGATTYTLDDSIFPANDNEMPIHWIELTPSGAQDSYIAVNEVTNRLYLNYIKAALDSSVVDSIKRPPQLLYKYGELLYENQTVNGDTSWVFLDLNDRSLGHIYYDPTPRTGGFKIDSGYEDHPVTGVSWHGAAAFAEFYGLRLPTEAEWEVCAKGDSANYRYPLLPAPGSQSNGYVLNVKDAWKRVNYFLENWNGTGRSPGTTPVGWFNGINPNTVDSPSLFGLYDMAGNVAEWVADWLGPYPSSSQDDPLADYPGPNSGIYKVIRGGSWQSTRAQVRCTVRNGESDLDACFPSVGFRCAYTYLRSP